ncbi:hypothetical protein Tco_1172393 [Tanacetum coccineum]
MTSLCSNNIKENLFLKHGLVSRTYSKKSLIMASVAGSKSKSFMTMSIPPQNEPSTNRSMAFCFPQDIPSTSDRHLIEFKNQVQCLMEAHLAPKQPLQVNEISSSCEICSGPHDTQYCMENPEQAFVEYASSRTDEVGDARLSKFEADFKQQQHEMSNKIDTFLKAITDRITGALPSDTKTFSAQPDSSINAITVCPKQPDISRNNNLGGEEHEEKDDSENINTNPSSPPDPSLSFITKKVYKLNSFLESLTLVS